jgi:prepilin peptidase CpaA
VENPNVEFMYGACTLFCTVVGAVYDVSTHKIPNAFTLPAILFALLLHFSFGGWKQLISAAAAGLSCGTIFLLFYLAGGMGAGDVKLIIAAGCGAGMSLIAPLLILTSLAGGVMAVGLALYHRRLKKALFNVCTLAVHHGTTGLTHHPEFNIDSPQALRLPYALAMAAGSALSLCMLMVKR